MHSGIPDQIFPLDARQMSDDRDTSLPLHQRRHSLPDHVGSQPFAPLYDDNLSLQLRESSSDAFYNDLDLQRRMELKLIPDEPFDLPDHYQPKLHDVVCYEKGVRVRDLAPVAGNLRFQHIINMHTPRYRGTGRRTEKSEIGKLVVESVRLAGGNFIKKRPLTPEPSSSVAASMEATTESATTDSVVDESSDTKEQWDDDESYLKTWRWQDIGNKKAREKASHALAAETRGKLKRHATDSSEAATASTTTSTPMAAFRRPFKRASPLSSSASASLGSCGDLGHDALSLVTAMALQQSATTLAAAATTTASNETSNDNAIGDSRTGLPEASISEQPSDEWCQHRGVDGVEDHSHSHTTEDDDITSNNDDGDGGDLVDADDCARIWRDCLSDFKSL